MAKKREVSMELKPYELADLTELHDSREALAVLQNAVIPFAREIAKRQRIWWDRVLESRGLTREGTSYAVEGGTIVDRLTGEKS